MLLTDLSIRKYSRLPQNDTQVVEGDGGRGVIHLVEYILNLLKGL